MFLAPYSEWFTKYVAFCSHSFEYACLKATKAYCYEKIRNNGKILSNALLTMAGEGDTPSIRPCQWRRSVLMTLCKANGDIRECANNRGTK